MNKNTIQIRIDRNLHKQLKYRAFDCEKTITRVASQMILHCLANNVILYDDLKTIVIDEDINDV
ncbi:MAG: hypothetical protein RLZZ70_150 [Candidatus Parcubacteria bacterium]|jgi:hypothetical protein